MDAHKALITNIFNNSTLVEVPFFQRPYVWKEDLWSRLLEDMEYVVKSHKPHFLGSIILKEGRKPIPGDLFASRKTVVDGQQRLTTFLVFLKVLYMKLNQMLMFDYQFRISGKEIALKHGKNDVKAFDRVMAMTSAVKLDNPAPGSRIIEAYNFFVDNVDASKLDIMAIIMNTQFVQIDLDADEDEQQIFDTINSLGVSLTTSELLKNYFFSRDSVAEYENKWESVFERDDDARMYWDTVIETGRVRRAMIDIFFDSYFQLFIQDRKYSISNEDKTMYDRVDKLALSYQHFINNYCGGDKGVVLNQMKDYATCFMQTFRPDCCSRSVPATFGMERLNVVIFGLKTSTLIPYVLYVAKNVFDEEERNKIYGVLESYVMRRMVVHSTTKNYNNLFTSLILNTVVTADELLLKLKTNGEATTYIPDDDELRHGFENSKLVNLQSKGIIYLIESRERPENSSTALYGFDNYSLEHLMPKKWRNNWEACETEEVARRRDALLLTMGNLAIIPQSLNASIRDADWDTKKNGKGKNAGLDICAAGLITMYDVLQKDGWREEDIQERALKLFSQAQVLWKL